MPSPSPALETPVEEVIEVNSPTISHVVESPVEFPVTNPEILEIIEPRTYQIPPRTTRGFSPKRYDPEFESQRSRYPINSSSQQLSQIAQAFNTSLYSTHLSKTLKEALENLNWKQAMQEEIRALEKKETWRKCRVPKGKKDVGCR